MRPTLPLVAALVLLVSLACAGGPEPAPSPSPEPAEPPPSPGAETVEPAPPVEVPSPTAEVHDHCVEGEEETLFTCVLQGSGKVVSVCSEARSTEEHPRLVYRYGAPGAVELTFPADQDVGVEAFRLHRNEPIRGMLSIDLSFERDGYRYTLSYQQTPSLPDEPGTLSRRLSVWKEGRTVFEDECDPQRFAGSFSFFGDYLDADTGSP